MASKAAFTAEEWHKIESAPINTALLIALASPSGPVGMAQELMAAVAAIVAVERDASSGAILKAIAAGIKGRNGKPKLPPIDGPEQGRTFARAELKAAIALLDAKAPDEAPAVKRWLFRIAQQAARADREKGLFGLRGPAVSSQERAMLRELASWLGLR